MYEKYVYLRDQRGITDYKVSKDTGITKSTFTDWKNGRSNPGIIKLKNLSKYFGVSIEYFLEDEEQMIKYRIKKCCIYALTIAECCDRIVADL